MAASAERNNPDILWAGHPPPFTPPADKLGVGNVIGMERRPESPSPDAADFGPVLEHGPEVVVVLAAVVVNTHLAPTPSVSSTIRCHTWS
jgi:hypothetical protein